MNHLPPIDKATDTPRTDAQLEYPAQHWVEADFARQLERELAEAKKKTPQKLNWGEILSDPKYHQGDDWEPSDYGWGS